MPPVFTSLSEAQYLLVCNWHTCSYGLNTLPSLEDSNFSQSLASSLQNSVDIFDKWSAALDAFLKNRGEALTPEKLKGHRICWLDFRLPLSPHSAPSARQRGGAHPPYLCLYIPLYRPTLFCNRVLFFNRQFTFCCNCVLIVLGV
jgi:hypothetical protein